MERLATEQSRQLQRDICLPICLSCRTTGCSGRREEDTLRLTATRPRRFYEASHRHWRHLLQSQRPSGTTSLVQAGSTIWSIGSAQGDHFAPSTATFMVNYRVEDLHALVKVLREEGCNVLEKIDESEYGKFAWVIDPEGNKVELWQPPAGQ